jgi:hypothetical protein
MRVKDGVPDGSSSSIAGVSSASSVASSPLANAALETLLCVLVDASDALRAFEEANGISTIVRTLKRTGVQRDVRYGSLSPFTAHEVIVL